MSSNTSYNAEELARASLPEGMFNMMPEAVQQSMIADKQTIIDNEMMIKTLRTQQETDKEKIIDEWIVEREKTVKRPDIDAMRLAGMKDRVREEEPEPVFRPYSERFDIDTSTAFPSDEPSPMSLLGGKVLGFRKESILELMPAMGKAFDNARAVQPSARSCYAYMFFTIWTNGKRRCGTRAVGTIKECMESDIDALYVEFDKLMKDIADVAEGYESIFEADHSDVQFKFTIKYFPLPECISNWGSDFKKIEKKPYFDIFTANGSDNCVVQCAKHIFGDDATEDTIEAIIERANKKVCILNLHRSVRHIQDIKDYSAFSIDPLSPIDTLNIIDKDTVYLLRYNSHVGVLENFKEQSRNRYYTSFRPLLVYPDCKQMTVCFDIECYFDPGVEGDVQKDSQRHVPYLNCACFVYDDEPGNVMEFDSTDCIASMLDYAVDVAQEFGHVSVELIAHNGGAYDFHYLLTSMHDPSIVKDIMIRNNHFISFTFKHRGIMFSVKDSYNFIGCSLASAAKAFLGPQDGKTDFPHHEVRTADDLQKVFQEWISVDEDISVNVEKEKMIITSDHVVKYKQDGECKRLMEWAKTYCINDVIVLAKVWIAFKKAIKDVFNCEIVDQTYTLAGLSFRLFEAHLPKGIKLNHPNKAEFTHMRKALVGGRCISMNGIYHDVACLDVKSLYPAAMAYYDQPYGIYRPVTKEIPMDNELGIYYCRVKPVTVEHHGFFPLRSGERTRYNGSHAEYEHWYTSVDIAIGRSEGHTIDVIPFRKGVKEGKSVEYVGYSWKRKGLIFKEYIEGMLYKLKLQYELEGNQEKRFVIKIIMNSLWGKFAQKWMDTDYNIQHEINVDLDEGCYPIYDTDCMLVKRYTTREQGNKPVQNGVFVLSWARYHMKKLWDACARPGAYCIYSDTDSIFVDVDMVDKSKLFELDGEQVCVVGDAMGQLEIECVFQDLVCVGPKQYMGKYDMVKYKKRFKGIPMRYVVPQLFAHLIADPSNVAKIVFLKFSREWGCITGYKQAKMVTQT
jgi:hypothetical protein